MPDLLVLRRVTDHGAAVVLGVGVIAVLVLVALPRSSGFDVPGGIVISGVVVGASLAAQAMAVVLVFRSHRFINFGLPYIGFVSTAVFTLLVQYRFLLRATSAFCETCAEQPSRTVELINYWASLAIALGVAVGLSIALYVFVVKPFENAPRLLLTVATIFLAPVAGAIVQLLGRVLTTQSQREDGLRGLGAAPLPFEFTISWFSPARFGAVDVLTVLFGVAAATCLFAYFRFSATGNVIKAASEDSPRAEMLGIDVNGVNLRVWVIVGLLSGVPALLTAMGTGVGDFGGLNIGHAARILLVALIARFVSLGLAAAAALVLGVVQQSVVWIADGSTTPVDASLFLVVAVVLLLHSRRPDSRAEIEAAGGWRATREVRPIPPELRDLPSVTKWVRVTTATVAVLVVGFPWTMSSAQISLGTATMIYAIVGLSLLVLTGWAGQISLGQFAFAALGGYVAAVSPTPFAISLVLGATAGAVAAVVLGAPALRLRGLYLAISTLALAVSTTALLINPRYLGRHLPTTIERPAFLGLDLDDQRTFYYFTLVMLTLGVVAISGLRRSRLGRVLVAARDNEQAAQSFGVSLVRVRLTAFAVSGFLAAFAGALYAFQQSTVSVSGFNEAQSFNVFTMAVLGGLGTTAGPIIGAVYHGLFTIFGASPLIRDVFAGIGPLVVLLLVRGGLSELLFGRRDSLLRRVASRHRIAVPSLVADVHVGGFDRRGVFAPKVRPGGGMAFVPERYALRGQWALNADTADDGTKDVDAFHGVDSQDLDSERVGG